MTPHVRMVLYQLRTAFLGRRLGAGAVQFFAHARYEITKVVAEQHEHTVTLGNVFATPDFGAIPALLIGEQHMVLVRVDSQRLNLSNRPGFLRARIGVVIDRFAGPIGDKENSDTGFPGSGYEFDDTRHWYRFMLLEIVVHLSVRERALERKLEIDIAGYGFVNVENDRWWQPPGDRVARHRTPGLVFDKPG